MKTFRLISLGCPKNTVDSEVMAGLLMGKGYTPVIEPGNYVDVLILNTCGFIETAKEESISRIMEAVEAKETGKVGKLVVAGCLAQRYPQALKEEIPEIDILFGIDGVENITDFLAGESSPIITESPTYIYSHKSPRAVSTGIGYAYLKIADGCNHSCSFCAIPEIRGKQRSRPIEDVVTEARALTDDGIRELILVAQDGTSYGRDLGLGNGLSDLLEELDKIENVGWIRPMYMFPGKITDKLLDVIASSTKVCPYVDIPLQHSSGSLLKSMRRPGDSDSYLRLLERIRERIPGVYVRTSLIVGYPGETDEDVEQLLSFVKEARFHHLGVFTYSREEGTPAFPLGETVSEAVKLERSSVIMEAQKQISHELNEKLVGQTLEVIVEGISEETDLLLQGRHIGQAPDIDGVVLINDGEAQVGEKKPVVIEQALFYDVVGRII
ncbi:MAG: 30S ribosomal protein S12 methylthiotransferase RimO [Acidobacteria bacterium]|nr:30S ribosomal protein S12 methylthiotransferase RimO [Acidobacteriota bacterium]